MRIASVMPSSSSTWGEISPDLLQKGCGGRETAFIRLAAEWAKHGNEVYCFAARQEPLEIPSGRGLVRYLSLMDAASTLRSVPFDAVVSWEEPQVFASPEILKTQADAVRLIEMQVAHVPPGYQDLEPGACSYVALSNWHKGFLESQEVNQKIFVLPNGIDLDRYSRQSDRSFERPHFVYSSSPDRGLARLLESWSMIREGLGRGEEPELSICYGVENWIGHAIQSHHRDGEDAVSVASALGLLPGTQVEEGINYKGRIGQHVLAEIQRDAVMCLYPADTVQPTETGCVTLIEACAAGAIPVTTDCDCIGEEFADVAEIRPLPFDPVDYAEAVLALWKDKGRREELRQKGRKFATERTWEKIAQRWLHLFATGTN